MGEGLQGIGPILGQERSVRRAAFFLLAIALALPAWGEDCGAVVQALNRRLDTPVDARELTETLRSLNAEGRLPAKFLTKHEARNRGWQPGRDLWAVPGLRGHSIGGDRFGNRERALPSGNWREADLDYRGGRRGAKRLVFSTEGARYVTVDHYRTFTEVPPCR